MVVNHDKSRSPPLRERKILDMNSLTSWVGVTVGAGDDVAFVVEPPFRFLQGGTCWVFGLG